MGNKIRSIFAVLALACCLAVSGAAPSMAGMVIPGAAQIGPQACTPTDNSGSSLVFTGVSCNTVRIGNVVYFYAVFTYPSIVSANPASIAGLPFPAANQVYGFASNGIVFTNAAVGGGPIAGATTQNASTMRFLFSNGDTAVTNTQLSLVQVIVMLIYTAA